MRKFLPAIPLSLLPLWLALAQPQKEEKPYAPTIAPASKEAEQSLKAMAGTASIDRTFPSSVTVGFILSKVTVTQRRPRSLGP